MRSMRWMWMLLLVVPGLGAAGCRSTGGADGAITAPASAPPSPDRETVLAETTLWRTHFTDPDLNRLVDAAIGGNNDLKAAVQRIVSARAVVTGARGAFLPAVNAVAGSSLQRFGEYTMDGAGNKGVPIYGDQNIPLNLPNFLVGVQAAWEMDIWGRLRSQKAAAVARFLANEEGRRLVLTGLVGDVAGIYYDILALDSTLRILDQNIHLQEEAFEAVRAQREAGLADALAVDQFEARLQNLRGLFLESGEARLDLEAALRILVGDAGLQIPSPAEAVLLRKPLPRLSLEVPGSLLAQRSDVRRAENELVAARADLRAARAAFYPAVNITGAVGFEAFRADLVPNPQSIAYNLAAGLAAPLVNRAAIRAAFQQAGAAELEALANYQQSIVNAFVEVRNHQAKVGLLEDLFGVKTREVELRARSVETSGDLFASRRATYLDVLIARQTALDSELELLQIRNRQFQLQIGLYRALGGG